MAAAAFVGLQSVEYPRKRGRRPFSSVAGFSQSQTSDSLSLKGLLERIQPLGLENFQGPRLQERSFLGQGASYNVFGCLDQSFQTLVAVKRIRPPDANSAAGAFENRVTCVLRDIEVMHHAPLARHENILKVLGYGWSDLRGDTIPYIVTELATSGTLKQYLSRTATSLEERLQLCAQIASGLQELYYSGVAHADLKLDNVLACSAGQGGENGSMRIIPKISDFGYSIMLSADDVGLKDYHGTDGYKPPETQDANLHVGFFNVRKCDLWTMGLVCWEILGNGVTYYETKRVRKAIDLAFPAMSPQNLSGTTLGSSRSRHVVQERLFTIKNQLKSLALDFVDEITASNSQEALICKEAFENLLEINPDNRSIRRLSETFSLVKASDSDSVVSDQVLCLNKILEKQWDFTAFKPVQMAQQPLQARKTILKEFERAALSKDAKQAAPAQLHIAFAHSVGFVGSPNMKQYHLYVRKSMDSGSIVAKAIFDLAHGRNLDGRITERSYYARRLRKVLELLVPRPLLASIGPDSNFADLENCSRRVTQASATQAIPAVIYAVYHNMTSKIPPGTRVNEKDPQTGETALAVACRIGNHEAVRDLLRLGANPLLPSKKGIIPLHWLFMFEEGNIASVANQLVEDWGMRQINWRSSHSYVMDPQFPLNLRGTPLAFAVLARADRAIEVLLSLGADPLVGYAESELDDIEYGDRSPLAAAAYLHLYGIFERLWEVSRPTALHSRARVVEKMANVMIHSSAIERLLVHDHEISLAGHKFGLVLQTVMNTPALPDGTELDCSPLTAAVTASNLNVVRALISTIYSGHKQAKDLLLASCVRHACNGQQSFEQAVLLISLALKHGGNINAYDVSEDGEVYFRPLDYLIEQKRKDLLLWLLDRNPDMTSPNPYIKSPLHRLLETGMYQQIPIEKFLSRGAPATARGGTNDESLLHVAVAHNLHHEVKILMDFGAAPSTRDLNGRSVLCMAVRRNNVKIIEQLLEADCDIDYTQQDGHTALSLAAAGDQDEVIRLLLQKGASLRASKPPAVHVAVKSGSMKALRTLLSQPGAASLKDEQQNTALQIAVSVSSNTKGHQRALECARLLLLGGADPNTRNGNFVEAIHEIFMHFRGKERLDLVNLFRSHGADLQVRDSQKITLLHLAAFMCDPPLVEYLLKAGASPDSLGNKGQTPLHDCIRSCFVKGAARNRDSRDRAAVIKLLADAGQNVLYQPYKALLGNGDEDVIRSLTPEPDHDVEVRPKRSNFSLRAKLREVRGGDAKNKGGMQKISDKMQAKKKRELEEKALKIEGIGVLLFRDNENKTPLELAAHGNHRIVVKQLLQLHLEAMHNLQQGIPSILLNDVATDIVHIEGNHSLISSHVNLISSVWEESIRSGYWAVVCEFLRSKCRKHVHENLITAAGGIRIFAWVLWDWEKRSRALINEFLGMETPLEFPGPSSFVPPWPKLSLPKNFAIRLTQLSRARKEPEQPIQELSNIEVELKQILDGMMWPWTERSANDVETDSPLYKVWTIICGLDLQTAQYFVGSEYLDFIIHLSGICPDIPKWPATEDKCFSISPGLTSTPIRLICDVWKDPIVNPRRVSKLAGIIAAYRRLTIGAIPAGMDDFFPELHAHIGFLVTVQMHETRKPMYLSEG